MPSTARLFLPCPSLAHISSSALLRRAASIGSSSAEISSLQSAASRGRLGSLSILKNLQFSNKMVTVLRMNWSRVTGNHANHNSPRNSHFASLPAPTYDFFNRQYEKLEPLVSHRKQTTAPLSNRQIPACVALGHASTLLRLFHFPYPHGFEPICPAASPRQPAACSACSEPSVLPFGLPMGFLALWHPLKAGIPLPASGVLSCLARFRAKGEAGCPHFPESTFSTSIPCCPTRKSSPARPRANSWTISSCPSSSSTTATPNFPCSSSRKSPNSASSAPISKVMAAPECPMSNTASSCRNLSAAIPACAALPPSSRLW